MKTKTIGLALVAALALSGLAGASSASAAGTTLCKTKVNSPTCAESDRYPAGTAWQASSTSVTMGGLNGIINPTYTCTSGTMSGTFGASGEPQAGTILKASFGGCGDNFGHKCTMTAAHLPSNVGITWTEGLNGSFAITRPKSSEPGMNEPGITIACETLPHCTYTAPNIKYNMYGGELGSAYLEVKAAMLKAESPECIFIGQNLFLTTKWVFSSPSPLYVSHL